MAQSAVIRTDRRGDIAGWNAAAEAMFGWSAADAIGRPLDLIVPVEWRHEDADLRARASAGETVTVDTWRHGRDGARIAVIVTAMPGSGPEADPAGITLVVSRQRALVTPSADSTPDIASRRLAAIVESSDDAIISKNLDGIVMSWNGAAERIFGFTSEEMIGTSIRRIIPEDRQGEEDTTLATIRRGDKVDHFETVRRRKNGALIDISLSVSPIRDDDGRIIGASKIARDITLLRQVYLAAQEANRLKDDFLASLSHELRTPLNAILGYARILRAGIIGPERQDKAIETIERNANSLTQIVEDVLDVSRIISGKMRLNVQVVDVPDIVQAAVDAVTPAADAKGVRIESVIDPRATPVSGDPDRLQQVLWNLASNAVKFTNRGGRVQVRLERVNSHVEIVVSDTGIGISREFLPHIFERFRQADAGITRERGGLGLGLAIARQLVEMHGGSIEVASGGTGLGSTFRVNLPVMIVYPRPGDEHRLHQRVGASATATAPFATDLSAIHVLAVDDDRDALALLSEVLASTGARVTTASSAADALAALDREVPDVLLADLGMPVADGFELIARVRGHANLRVREVPAAALTAYARSDDRVKALRAGFQIHLAKPIEPAELITTVAALAGRFAQDR